MFGIAAAMSGAPYSVFQLAQSGADGQDAEAAIKDALAATAQDGRFRLGGLSERTYCLLAYDPASLLAVQSDPIAAGSTGVVLRVPADTPISFVPRK